MPMISCPECRKQISEFANMCPKCGITLTEELVKKQKTPQTPFTMGGVVFMWAFILIFIVVAFGGSSGSQAKYSSSTQVASGQNSSAWGDFDAKYFAEAAIKKRLKSPSTAKFPRKSEYRVTHNGSTWHVRGFVDAQNGFGAMLRKHWIIQLTEQPNGLAKVVKASIL